MKLFSASTTVNPAPAEAPAPKTNRIGLQVLDYRGGKTTLCAGCGQNAISERMMNRYGKPTVGGSSRTVKKIASVFGR